MTRGPGSQHSLATELRWWWCARPAWMEAARHGAALQAPTLQHLQGASPDVLHEVVVAKDSYETPSWVWSHYVKSEALTVDVHASAFNAVASRYITKADDPWSLDEPPPRAKKVGAWPLSPHAPLSLASCVSLPSCHLRATGCTASGCGSTLRTGASARASSRRWRAACARCASAGAGWWHCCPFTRSRHGELLRFNPPAPAPCAHAAPFIAQVPHVRAACARGALPARQGGVPQPVHG